MIGVVKVIVGVFHDDELPANPLAVATLIEVMPPNSVDKPEIGNCVAALPFAESAPKSISEVTGLDFDGIHVGNIVEAMFLYCYS